MIPIFLDPAQVCVGLIGRGAVCVRRLVWLRGLGAEPQVYSDAPSAELRVAAGASLVEHLPTAMDLRHLAAIWSADLEPASAQALVALAKALNVLVNVEDVQPLCAFHTPAVVKRGRLLLAAGTGGASPAAAALVRERLESMFPAAWSEALEELARARIALRATGADLAAISADARVRLCQRALIDAGASP